jgi:ABC-type branched-subunit amino acid transport system substrate-binding protein
MYQLGRRAIGLALVLALAAACGQRADQRSADPGRPTAGQDAGVPSAAGIPVTPDNAAPTAPDRGAGTAEQTAAAPGPAPTADRPVPVGSTPAGGGTTGSSTPTAARSAGSATTASPTGATAAPPSASPGPGSYGPPSGPVDRTGVSDTVIKIGVHAPITGAAPIPQNAFDKGKDVYWKFLAERGGLLGRNVQIIFKDDQFNPSHAVQVCRELVEQDKVFMLFGVTGSDQITACARYADSAGVPYLSGGVNEDGLTGLPNYFAVSQTYPQQNRTIVGLVKNVLHKTKIAIVLNATPALDQTQRSITALARAAGLQIVRQSRISKQASDAELVSEANQLRASGAEAVYLLTAPVNFIKLATNAYAQAYSPLWTGPGLTNGLNIVTEAGCPAVNGAHWMSPFPGLDAIDRLDPDYRPAYRKYAGGEPDDIGLAEWGLNKTFRLMLEAAGRDLSRQGFVRALTSGKPFASNVFPTVAYDGSIRFGANSMHVLEADCSTRKWKTMATFAQGF